MQEQRRTLGYTNGRPDWNPSRKKFGTTPCKSRVEHLLATLQEDTYTFKTRVDDRHRLTHLMFAHNDALRKFDANPDVIMMDCTYKTNRFGMPLLNVVGITGMNTTIHIAQVFMRGETNEDCEWALRQLLLNALKSVFPETPVLLCLWHIFKDEQAHARKRSFPQVVDTANTNSGVKWKGSDSHRTFCGTFIPLTCAETEQEYEQWRRLPMWIKHGSLDKWKKRIVRHWTNQVIHFGLQATSRVEGAIHRYKTDVSDAQVRLPVSLCGKPFTYVVKRIHNYALQQCNLQLQIISSTVCTGIYKKTTGLPSLRVDYRFFHGDFMLIGG
uniref:MULE transposase domain-containing protein n=1 Tax=Lagenidium giganteum TaxID=4803 RepID=A0AAV2Z140_9STRA